MPRYYFNVRFGPHPKQLAIDPEGDELPDLAAARDHALVVARDLIARTQLSTIRDWFVCSFEIEDVEARSLLTVPFSDTVPDRDGLDGDEQDSGAM
ncbi:hypothetical protein [Methylobacterium sp.]|jgi:hypothetical protein|uniref:DUF6894 family protein n=1 Tax=Methylobacterium sp. TaxID=409 RepID=UPI002608A0F1|nr:hypothetical protein [Methylobacterium sp.]MDB5645472.1 hypothetical protein [Methylobacterium sp.]